MLEMILQVSRIALVSHTYGSSLSCDLMVRVRAGIFFFTLALFGFSCLSSLGLFANERLLFMRERYVGTDRVSLDIDMVFHRANGYYSTFTYFSSKVSSLP